ncbi:MAG: tetratricopeptide repeat protein [Candidatus Krumholzibacteriia bacterium]
MSKVSKLKQEAYQAGKKRDWDKVIVLYERILEVENNNPSLINELGDACLKRGDTPRAVEHFLSAAEKYRLTGLLNNAVAIYKKILRFEAGNMNAHWYLAESRANQGMFGDGLVHALQFLAPAERLGAEFRAPYVKRCVRMLALFPAQPEVLSRLAELFRHWALPLEGGRVALLQACLTHASGRADAAEKAAAALLAEHPDLTTCPEYQAWRRQLGDMSAAPAPVGAVQTDHNAIELGAPPADRRVATPGGAPSDRPAAEPAPAAAAVAADDRSLAQSLGLVDLCGADGPGGESAGFPLGELDGASGEHGSGLQRTARSRLFGEDESLGGQPPAAEPEADPESSDEARFEIAVEDVPSFADLARELESERAAPAASAPTIDLLAEILAESADEDAAGENRQVETIVDEIGRRVGGDQAQDPASQYDMGLVYLEMELYGQAEECFESASQAPELALRSYEMWGIALIRQARFEEAVDVLGRGLRVPGRAAGDLLGLLYHTGQAYEQAGRSGAAREYYERVYHAAPDFLDIEKRLEALESI